MTASVRISCSPFMSRQRATTVNRCALWSSAQNCCRLASSENPNSKDHVRDLGGGHRARHRSRGHAPRERERVRSHLGGDQKCQSGADVPERNADRDLLLLGADARPTRADCLVTRYRLGYIGEGGADVRVDVRLKPPIDPEQTPNPA